MEFLTQIPTSLTGWLMSIMVTAGAAAYLFSMVRRADMKILRDTNEDALKRIKQLEDSGTQQDAEIINLKGKVEMLEKQNKTLEDLVIVALKQYFFENPTTAKRLKDIIKS